MRFHPFRIEKFESARLTSCDASGGVHSSGSRSPCIFAARSESGAAGVLPLDSEVDSESPPLILPLHSIFGRLLATELVVAQFTPAMHMIFAL